MAKEKINTGIDYVTGIFLGLMLFLGVSAALNPTLPPPGNTLSIAQVGSP
jgi:hypothetical protein